MKRKTIKYIATRLDEIVNDNAMPDINGSDLRSSAILLLTKKCSISSFANAIAHIRLCIPEEFQDATAALAELIDECNKS